MLKQPTKVKCPKCGYEWWYKGDNFLCITCSKCKFSIRNVLNKKRGDDVK
jgi:predicted nucleic-acid-binding Zn-ribbon protein